MNDLKKLADALPPLENVDHYENLQKAFDLNGWVQVDAYIDIAMQLAHVRGIINPKVVQSTNKKLSLLRRALNALK